VRDISLAVGVGLLCALLSALGTNLAFLLKYKGAVAAPDVDMRHPLRSAIDLFRSRWWSIGWGVAALAFALHVAALTLAPISIGQAVLAGSLVFLAVLAERFFGFELGCRQWIGIGLVAVSLSLLTLTGADGGGGANSGYSLAGMIIFGGVAVCVGLLLILSHLIERIPAQRGVLLGIAAGLGFGISDVAIKALSGDLDGEPVGLLSPWSVIIVTAAVFSFYASARSLQNESVVAEPVPLILVGTALIIGVRLAAFAHDRVAQLPGLFRSGQTRDLGLPRLTARAPRRRERAPGIGDGVAVIAVTSVAANLATIIAGVAVFGTAHRTPSQRDGRVRRRIRRACDVRPGDASPGETAQ
jgi:drug/metabolite transporter (DMT)-like permease